MNNENMNKNKTVYVVENTEKSINLHLLDVKDEDRILRSANGYSFKIQGLVGDSVADLVKGLYSENKIHFVDFFQRFTEYNLKKTFWEFMGKVYKEDSFFKLRLSESDLEKTNKKYLFYKPNNEVQASVIRTDEFIKSFPILGSKLLKELHSENFYYDEKYNLNRYMNNILHSYVVIIEAYDRERKYNFIISNDKVIKFIDAQIKHQKTKWGLSDKDKYLLREIKKAQYTVLDYEEKEKNLKEKLNSLKKEFNIIDNSITKKRRNLNKFLSYGDNLPIKELKRIERLKNNLSELIELKGGISDEISEIQEELKEMRIKQDSYLNEGGENRNLSFELMEF